MNTPMVSICLPTYNRPDFLELAVRSCLAQTYRDLEIVITDNSPSDESGALARRLNDPRTRYCKNVQTIFREDEFLVNKLRLLISVLREILSSVFPRSQPLPRE
jgi:glycosyltransferase involved in cell wall biosynthesis